MIIIKSPFYTCALLTYRSNAYFLLQDQFKIFPFSEYLSNTYLITRCTSITYAHKHNPSKSYPKPIQSHNTHLAPIYTSINHPKPIQHPSDKNLLPVCYLSDTHPAHIKPIQHPSNTHLKPILMIHSGHRLPIPLPNLLSFC